MRLDIQTHGIVRRRDDGSVTIRRPARRRGPGVTVEVPKELAEGHLLASGDVVHGATALVPAPTPEPDPNAADDVSAEPDPPPIELVERLTSVVTINGWPAAEALDRPSPRKRSGYDRAAPERLIPLATGPDDVTGRMLDLAAPFAAGYAGIVHGPHSGGMTRCLQSVVRGVTRNAPDVIVMVLLVRARDEETTDWRRLFPDAETVACPSAEECPDADERIAAAELVLACAQRQTELGRHVLLAVDSLTAVWADLLDGEDADAQFEADQSAARLRIREWMQAAGWFGGEGLLGSGLGGSLTLVGTVWQMPVDAEEEEERESHPHLRLLEHILDGVSWRVPLSAELAGLRLYPAIDVQRCISGSERALQPEALYERRSEARRRLARLRTVERHTAIAEALDRGATLEEVVEVLAGGPDDESV